MIRRDELDARVGGDRRAGFRDDLAVDGHLAGEDQRAGALTRRREAAIDDEHIQANLRFHVPTLGINHKGHEGTKEERPRLVFLRIECPSRIRNSW